MIGIGRGAARIAAALMLTAVSMHGLGAGAAGAATSPNAAKWNEPHKPFRIYGNTYYVGTAGLSSILITSDYGHVLIDGAFPQSAKLIAANIEALGFKITDVKAILNSHVHPDHAGGIAELQKLSGGQVYALRGSEPVLRTGKLTKEDPQYAQPNTSIPPVGQVWVVQDDQLLGVGAVRLRVMATPGHTAGGTSWSWDACEGARCLTIVYADSLSAVSSPKYKFKDHPEVLQQFESSFKRLETAPCDLLLTPHPERSQIMERVEPAAGKADVLKDAAGCVNYVKQAREDLAKRLASEG
jgi:metallo-beta-lactamase class B